MAGTIAGARGPTGSMPARPRWWSFAVVFALALAPAAGASVQAPEDGQSLDGSAEPADRLRAGHEALRTYPRETVRARAIGESLIRDFPGTVHAVAGLELIFRAGSLEATDDGALADLAALADRLEAIVAAAPAARLELTQAASELRREIDWARGMLYVDRGRVGDEDGFFACVQVFEELARRLGEAHARTPVALFNAGQCLLMTHELERAREIFKDVADRYPHADVAERAHEEVIDIARSLARFEETATLIERHAARYPTSRKTGELLREAVTIRLALGHEALLRADVALFEQLRGRDEPEAAAGVRWLLTDIETTEAARRAHAGAYLLRYGHAGGRDRQIVAEATIAAIDWQMSCPSGHVIGLCVGPPAKRRGKIERCAEPTTPTPRARTKRLAEAAQARLVMIGKLARSRAISAPRADLRRAEDFADAVGLSRLAVLDRELEALMAMQIPTGLRLTVDPAADGAARKRQSAAYDESARRLMTHVEVMRKRSSELFHGYIGLAAEKRGWKATLAASHRVGLLNEFLFDHLLSVEIPRELVEPKVRAAYCKQLRELAEPYREQALGAYLYCAERAVMYQTSSEASRACGEALSRLAPRSRPPLHEFVGAPEPWGELPLRSVGIEIEPAEGTDEVDE